MKPKRRNLRPWLESRLRRLSYKLDRSRDSMTPDERTRCEYRELQLKRALHTGWQSNAPTFTRTMREAISRAGDRLAQHVNASNP